MIEPLPIDEILPAVKRVLGGATPLLLMAPPGSGKTTRVPPALLSVLSPEDGSIVVLEPRRLAARAAAARVAEELGCELGGLVGYQVRGDSRVSKRTRIRFVTEGVLVRQLVHDPFLEGVAAVCLDEFHERHLEGDLALAMLAETRGTVRPDLRLCVMSATLAPKPLLRFLPGAEVLEADGRLFPVEVKNLDRRGDRRLEALVRDGVDRALAETPGDVLVFLPGVGEISRSQAELAHVRDSGVLVLPLHGRLDAREQDRAIRPQAQRKVVLSTNVAESSLTIAGVTAVVDSGQAREMRFDRGRGTDVLELGQISRASARQRTGRAGRTGPGICYRLWTAVDERAMPEHSAPEIQRVDLAAPALLVRAFAGRDPLTFDWFEAPAADALALADHLLADLGALDVRSGNLTKLGQQLLELPLHPRLGAVVLAGRQHGAAVAAATAATLLSDVDRLGREDGADLEVATEAFLMAEERGFPAAMCREFGSLPGPARALLAARDRLLPNRRVRKDPAARDPSKLTRCLLAGFPDRVALRSATGDSHHATMVGGRGVIVPKAMDGHDLLLALRLLETGRQQRSRVVLAAALSDEDLEQGGVPAPASVVEARLDEAAGRVFAVREVRYRDLVLRSARGGELPRGAAAELLRPLLEADPWRWLGDDKDSEGLRHLLARMKWLRERMPDQDLPDWGDGTVGAAAAELLGDRTQLRELNPKDVAKVLQGQLGPQQQRALREFAPDRIELPSGRGAPVDYGAEAGPTVAARLQEFFGLPSVGGLAGGRVPVVLQLLAPNHRPVQVTTDLASFWSNVYPQIRRELSRRYPRHSWPEDPLAAKAESRPARRKKR